MRLMREALGHHDDVLHLLEAPDGEQGLAMVASHRPALVILGLRMPDPAGFAVLEQLRADPDTAHTAVVVVTASDLSEAERTRLAGEHVEFKVNLSGEDLLAYVKQRLASHKPEV